MLPFVVAHGFLTLRLLFWAVFGVVPVVLSYVGIAAPGARARLAARVGALGLVAVAAWSTLVEPRWLEIGRIRIPSPKLEEPVRIVVVADLQTDRWTSYEERVFEAIAAEKPDVLLFTGDYLQAPSEDWPRLAASFRSAAASVGSGARLGAWAVQGDADPDPAWRGLFDGLPIRAVPETRRFEVAGLVLTALSVRDSRSPETVAERVAGLSPTDRFHVVFGHAPDFALGRPRADLLLAGHVHGGQVRFPFVGPLLTLSAVPRSWAVGRTDFEDGSTLVVSRGLGMERGRAPRLRFLCRPELLVVDLVPEARRADRLPLTSTGGGGSSRCGPAAPRATGRVRFRTADGRS